METHLSGGGVIERLDDGWRLRLPAGEGGTYRLAQIDDYHGLPRRDFPHRPPCWVQVQARASRAVLPGTWGFGLWNDPFSLWLSGPADRPRLPDLPNALWFFHASAPNHLSFRDDLPAVGWLAATFSAPRWPWPLRLIAGLGLPLAWVPGLRDGLRRLAGQVIRQDSVQLEVDVTTWHTYTLCWEAQRSRFWVDEELVLDTPCVPHPPLGLVLWVDNQYAAWRRGCAPRFGTLATPEPVWVEFRNLKVGKTLAKAPRLCYNSRRTGA